MCGSVACCLMIIILFIADDLHPAKAVFYHWQDPVILGIRVMVQWIKLPESKSGSSRGSSRDIHG